MGYFDEKINELKKLLSSISAEKTNLSQFVNFEKNQLDAQIKKLIVEKDNFEKEVIKIEAEINKRREDLKRIARERQVGFPWLAEAFDEYFKLEEMEVINYLRSKKHPAYSAGELVREQSKLRRQAEKDKRIAQYLVKYYETICPFLVDLKEEIKDEDVREDFREYSDEEKEDQITRYLTIDEYRRLPAREKNQMALDRYVNRPKSKVEIGRMYERYVGYEFETKGFDVSFKGIIDGFEDLGRDLICKREKQTVIVQCKMWAHYKTVYEKHIFQFFGTVFQYKDEHPYEHVEAQFFTTTKLSELARKFSKALGITLREGHEFEKNYPCIKCNVSEVTGEKIYHLPFDQQYDKVKIRNPGEFYCRKVEEAEDSGFRRAFRYRGKQD